MRLQSIVVASAVVGFAAGLSSFASPVKAQDAMARQAELAGFHQAMRQGRSQSVRALRNNTGRNERATRRVATHPPGMVLVGPLIRFL